MMLAELSQGHSLYSATPLGSLRSTHFIEGFVIKVIILKESKGIHPCCWLLLSFTCS